MARESELRFKRILQQQYKSGKITKKAYKKELKWIKNTLSKG